MTFDGERDDDLVMPFVATASNGGPYDDLSYVAGYATGQLDQILRLASAAAVSSVVATIRVGLAAQLDLIGMRWGYQLAVDDIPGSPGWAMAVFSHHHGGQ